MTNIRVIKLAEAAPNNNWNPMTLPSSICVYCGSASDVAQSYRNAAVNLGRLAGEQGIEIVYGGGRVGLMGLVADAALAAGGKVTGIIPRHIVEMEVAHRTLTELIVVETMHQRKQMMADRADAFAILPGGLGTLDEAFEILTWKQLGLHDKPIFVINVEGYWDPLLALVRNGVDEGFIRPRHAGLFTVITEIEVLLPGMTAAMQGVDAARSFT
jgi:uncharacterized protein (TIGR00730 family)